LAALILLILMSSQTARLDFDARYLEFLGFPGRMPPEAVSCCKDIHDQALARLYQVRKNSAYLPITRAEHEWLPVYVLESGGTIAEPWRLLVTREASPFTSPLPFFEFGSGCDIRWLGPVSDSAPVIATTIKGRFLTFGIPDGRADSTFSPILHALDTTGRGRQIGDTLFVNVLTTPLATSPVALREFNSIVPRLHLGSGVLEAERLVDLYLKVIYPFQTLFIINDPSELDQLYSFRWSNPRDPVMHLSDSTWAKLLTPGICDGRILRSLPETVSPRPLYLPSVVLEENDGGWFKSAAVRSFPDSTIVTRTILGSYSRILMEVRFTISTGDIRIVKVQITRMFSLRYYLTRVNWQ